MQQHRIGHLPAFKPRPQEIIDSYKTGAGIFKKFGRGDHIISVVLEGGHASTESIMGLKYPTHIVYIPWCYYVE